jgi:hypothetical protein
LLFPAVQSLFDSPGPHRIFVVPARRLAKELGDNAISRYMVRRGSQHAHAILVSFLRGEGKASEAGQDVVRGFDLDEWIGYPVLYVLR